MPNIETISPSIGEAVLVQDGDATCVLTPWVERPFHFVSWWEMERFSAEKYMGIAGGLAVLSSMCAVNPHLLQQPFKPDRLDELRDEILAQVAKLCGECGLNVSAELADRWIAWLNEGHAPTFGEMVNRSEHLEETIAIEMQQRLFMYIPPERAKYYDQKEAFGPEASAAFPSAAFDVVEAGNCFAAGRYTACVMHLSRAVEGALTALAERELGLPQRNDWGKHLSDIEKELEKRYKAAGARSADELFYAEAAAQIGHIKTAWRNPTMHVDRTYTEEMAEAIMGAIKSFMRHLATRIHERRSHEEENRIR